MNSQPREDYGSAASLRDDLSRTLMSLRDSFSTSMQTLSLTLASMNNTLRNMAPNGSSNMPSFSNFLPSMGNNFTGSMSQPMAGYLSTASGTDMMGFNPKPFNVSGMEFYKQREMEMRYRTAPMALGVGVDVANAGSMYAAYKAANVASRVMKLGTMKAMGLSMAAGMGVSMAVGIPLGAIERESENYSSDAAMFARQGGRFSGNQMSHGQSLNMSSWLNTAGNREMHGTGWDATRLGTEGYRDLASTGLAAGLFHGQNTDQLKKQIESAAGVVRFLAGVMGSTDVKEAIQAIVQLKTLGFNPVANSSFARQLGKSAFGLGQITGISSQQMLGMGIGIGQSVQQATGVNGLLGMRYGMQGYANSQMLERSGVLNFADIALLGGHEGAAQRYAMGMANATQNPAFGGMLTAAMMGPNGNLNGSLNTRGGYFGMMGAAQENIMSPGRFAMWQVNQPNLQSQLGQIRSDNDPILGMIQSAISPIVQASGAKGRQERTAMSAMIIARQLGVDLATAKSIATMAEYPEFTRRREAAARGAISRGEGAETRNRYTLGSRAGQFGDNIGRSFSDIYAGFTEGVHGMSNTLEEWTGDSALKSRADFDALSSQAFDPAMLRNDAIKFTGGHRRSSDTSRPSDEMWQNYVDHKHQVGFLPSWLDNKTKAYADQLEAYDKQTNYKSYYENNVKGNLGGVSGLAGKLGLKRDNIGREYQRSNFNGKIGGGLEFVRSLLGDPTASSSEVLSLAGALENQFTDKARLEQIMKKGDADFSGIAVAEGEKALGMGAKDIAGMASKFTDSSYVGFGKVIAAHVRDNTKNDDGSTGEAENQVEAVLSSLGLSGPEETQARALLKTINKYSFVGMSADDITEKVKGIVRGAVGDINDKQFDITASQIWQLSSSDAVKLREGLGKGGAGLVESLNSIDLSNSPGLRDLKERQIEITGALKQYDGKASVSSLSKQQQRALSDKLKVDIGSNQQHMSIEELGIKATTNAVNLAQGAAIEKFDTNSKDIASTFVQVGSKNAVAVVVMTPPEGMVRDLNSESRKQIITVEGRPVKDKGEAAGGNRNSTPERPIDPDGKTDQ